MQEGLRLFLGVDLEDDSLLTRILEIQEKFDLKAGKIKLVEKENIHFTLRFFGETPPRKAEEIHKALSKIDFEPFEIEIAGVGAFPTLNRPRVVWIGVEKNESIFIDLKENIDQHLAKIGYAIEKRFKPHATIARIRYLNDRSRLVSSLTGLSSEYIGSMYVSKACMKKSTLTSKGPIYETLWQIPEN